MSERRKEFLQNVPLGIAVQQFLSKKEIVTNKNGYTVIHSGMLCRRFIEPYKWQSIGKGVKFPHTTTQPLLISSSKFQGML